MKPFLKKVARFMRGDCPTLHRRYDVSGDVYKNGQDSTPAFSYAFKGEYRMDLRHVLLILSALLVLCCGRKKDKKK